MKTPIYQLTADQRHQLMRRIQQYTRMACIDPDDNDAMAILNGLDPVSQGPAKETDSLGIPKSCKKPLCAPGAHHPLCSMYSEKPVAAQPLTDSELLDWLESQGSGDPWVARQSTTGRGYRLHNDKDGKHATVRVAISRAIEAANGIQEPQ